MEPDLSAPFTLPLGWVVTSLVAAVGAVLVPLALVLVARRRLGGSWAVAGWGALVFVLAQGLTRIPLVTVLGIVLKDELTRSATLRWAWLGALALSAGIFEEIGRYLGYLLLRRRGYPLDRSTGILFGLGHGGIESILLVGVMLPVTLAGLYTLASGGLDLVPPDHREAAEAQMRSILGQPAAYPLFALVERVGAVILHTGLSLWVLRAVSRARPIWLVGAVLFHGAANFAVVGLLELTGRGTAATALAETLVIAFGIAGLALGLRLARSETPTPERGDEDLVPKPVGGTHLPDAGLPGREDLTASPPDR